MRAVVVVAVVLFVGSREVSAQSKTSAATCHADRDGEDLITKIEYPDGYTVEGPWRVTATATEKGAATTVTAELDHIVEIQAISREQHRTPLPGIVEMTFRGNSVSELLNEAANVWCATVIHARPKAPQPAPPRELVADLHIT